jgi:hypothetical protein
MLHELMESLRRNAAIRLRVSVVVFVFAMRCRFKGACVLVRSAPPPAE